MGKYEANIYLANLFHKDIFFSSLPELYLALCGYFEALVHIVKEKSLMLASCFVLKCLTH
jgi:hypothetical protein